MRFLADEHIPAGVIAALRAAGHDVLSAALTAAGADDVVHVETAAREHRVILTEDGDFVARVRDAVAAGAPLPEALIHYRLDGLGRDTKMARMIDAVARIGNVASGTIYSVAPTRIRSRAMHR